MKIEKKNRGVHKESHRYLLLTIVINDLHLYSKEKCNVSARCILHTVYRLLIESKTLQLWVELTEDTPVTHILVYVKGRGHIEVMNVHSMLSHGDTCTPMCQIWYGYVKKQRRSCPDTFMVKI